MPPEAFDRSLGARYRLEDQIGAGAYGEVWSAADLRTGERVAAKILHSRHLDDPEVVGRFVVERSLLIKLRHPSVVAVRDLVVDGDRVAIVMELVPDGSLRDVLRSRGTLPPQLAVDVVAAVLDGLAVAHGLGVVHRDIKPDNVLLAASWWSVNPGDVKLVDFGIARMVAEGQSGSTAGMGTPYYMAPEVIERGEAGSPADVYGAAIMLYELLAGRTPFASTGVQPFTIARRHVDLLPPPLPVPDRLRDAMAQLLGKDPAARPSAADAATLLRDLRAELGDLRALAPQPTPGPDDFESARPVTLVRGLLADRDDDTSDSGTGPAGGDGGDGGDGGVGGVPLDLGPSGNQTLHRPLAPRPQRPERAHAVAVRKRPGWRDPRLLAGVGALVVLVAGAGLFVGLRGDDSESGEASPTTPASAAPEAGPVRAQQQDLPLPTGLTVSRTAEYDAETGLVTLTLDYAAQAADLAGPFLEVIPGLATDGGTAPCPTVQWTGEPQTANLPSTTGISVPCGYAVDAGTVGAQQRSEPVTARFALDLGDDPAAALQQWLDGAAAATTTAAADPDVVSSAYPVQRMQDVQVVAPSSTVSGRTLRLTLLPVWPSGPDELNPLYQSPSVGEPTTMLRSVAGDERGVRFSDGCSGNLSVSSDGLVVTAQSQAPDCVVSARVGNFADLESNTFAIVNRGG